MPLKGNSIFTGTYELGSLLGKAIAHIKTETDLTIVSEKSNKTVVLNRGKLLLYNYKKNDWTNK